MPGAKVAVAEPTHELFVTERDGTIHGRLMDLTVQWGGGEIIWGLYHRSMTVGGEHGWRGGMVCLELQRQRVSGNKIRITNVGTREGRHAGTRRRATAATSKTQGEGS